MPAFWPVFFCRDIRLDRLHVLPHFNICFRFDHRFLHVEEHLGLHWPWSPIQASQGSIFGGNYFEKTVSSLPWGAVEWQFGHIDFRQQACDIDNVGFALAEGFLKSRGQRNKLSFWRSIAESWNQQRVGKGQKGDRAEIEEGKGRGQIRGPLRRDTKKGTWRDREHKKGDRNRKKR